LSFTRDKLDRNCRHPQREQRNGNMNGAISISPGWRSSDLNISPLHLLQRVSDFVPDFFVALIPGHRC
jgi:hypothetical protein